MSELFRSFEISRLDDEARMVYGIVSTDAVASDGYIVTKQAILDAWPEYMQFGNVREMHQEIAAGVVRESEMTEAGMSVGVYVAEDSTWQKVKAGVLKAFSIRGPILEAVDNIVNKIKLLEISLVDRPADPGALVTMFRADGAGHHRTGPQAQGENMSHQDRQALAAEKPSMKRDEGGDIAAAGVSTPAAAHEVAEKGIVRQISEHLDAVGALVSKFNALHDSEELAPEVLAHCQNAHRSLGRALAAHVKAATAYGATDGGDPADSDNPNAKRSESLVPFKPALSRADEIGAKLDKVLEALSRTAAPAPAPTTLRTLEKAQDVVRAAPEQGDGFPEQGTAEWFKLPEAKRFEIADLRNTRNINGKI